MTDAIEDGTRGVRFAAAGYELARLDRHAEAARKFEEALAALDIATTSDGLLTAVQRVRWLAAATAARLELGGGNEALPRLEGALAALDTAAREAGRSVDAEVRVATAEAQLSISRLHGNARRLAQAQAALVAALGHLAGLDAAALRAPIEFQLGAVLAVSGAVVEALSHYDAAKAAIAASGVHAPVRLRARLAMNRGIVLSDVGRHRDALASMDGALDLFRGLAEVGRNDARAELARAQLNQAYALARSGDHHAAVRALRAAVADYELLLRHGARSGMRMAWRTSLGTTLSSLGYSLLMLGELDAAGDANHRATAVLARCAPTVSAAREVLPRVFVNLAHVRAHQNRLVQAVRAYRRAEGALAALMANGHEHLKAYRINAQLGSARVELRRGKDSAEGFESAMGALSALTHEGQIQHARAWLAAWCAQRDVWLAAPVRAGRATAAALVRVLNAPPRHPLGVGPEPFEEVIEAAADRSVALVPTPERSAVARPAEDAIEGVAAAYLRYLLQRLAALLSESDPVWLQAHRPAAEAAIDALRDAAAVRTDASSALADWFFATRGLRAQRNALALGDESRIAELRGLLQRLHRMEQEVLGERTPAAAEAATPIRASIYATAPSDRPQAREWQRDWRKLATEVQERREALVAAGLLPQTLLLDSDRAGAALGPGSALLLLAREEPARLLVLAIHRPPPHRGAARDVQRRHLRPALDAELAAFPCATLHGLARAAWRSAANVAASGSQPSPRPSTVPEETDLFALEMFERLWDQAVGSTVEALHAEGINDISLVPSGDMHLVPWNHLADRHFERSVGTDATSDTRRLRVYPSVGAWWRCVTAAGETPRATQWALVADAADGATAARGSGVRAALPWVEVERRLSQQLWGGKMTIWDPLSSDQLAADALLGMGHGQLPDANPAHSGLTLGAGVLRPHHLLRLGPCRRAVMSACLLGHTEEARGEALGFLSGCFDHQALFAAGWLTEVPDRIACLHSVALQWAIRRAPCGEGEAADWSDAVAGARRALRRGRWPEGMLDWLAKHWPNVEPNAPIPEQPPELLKRALPWTVTLGR